MDEVPPFSEVFRKTLAKDPNNVYARFELANALASEGKHDEAVANLDHLLRVDPNYENGAAWYNRGNSLGPLGRFEEAVRSYDEALARPFDDRAAALSNKAHALEQLGRHDLAEGARRAASAEAAVEGEQLLERANRHFADGEWAKAIALYRASIARGWEGAHVALLNGAICNNHLKKNEAALEWIDECLRRAPNFVPAIAHKGIFLNELGRSADAIAWLDRALEAGPDPIALFNRGCAHATLGQADAALADLRHAISLSADLREYLNESSLDSLRHDPRFGALTGNAR